MKLEGRAGKTQKVIFGDDLSMIEKKLGGEELTNVKLTDLTKKNAPVKEAGSIKELKKVIGG
jgi:hypothetical protein